MIFNTSTLIDKVRTAIDSVSPIQDEFTSTEKSEITQAIRYACMQIIDEADLTLLEPVVVPANIIQGAVYPKNDGSGHILLPPDYMRLVELKMASWAIGVSDVADPSSEIAKMQACPWTCGSVNKPILVGGFDKYGNRILRYWKVGRCFGNTATPPSGGYDHSVEYLQYVPEPNIEGEDFNIPLKTIAEPQIVFRAAGIYLEGKKEEALANRMYQLSKKVINDGTV